MFCNLYYHGSCLARSCTQPKSWRAISMMVAPQWKWRDILNCISCVLFCYLPLISLHQIMELNGMAKWVQWYPLSLLSTLTRYFHLLYPLYACIVCMGFKYSLYLSLFGFDMYLHWKYYLSCSISNQSFLMMRKYSQLHMLNIFLFWGVGALNFHFIWLRNGSEDNEA